MLLKELDAASYLNREIILIRPDNTKQPKILDFDALGTISERVKLWQHHKDNAMRVLSKAFGH